jgi:hypothetical protein
MVETETRSAAFQDAEQSREDLIGKPSRRFLASAEHETKERACVGC